MKDVRPPLMITGHLHRYLCLSGVMFKWTARESNLPSLVCKTSVTPLRLPAHGAEERACGLLLYLIVYPEVRKCLLSPSESG